MISEEESQYVYYYTFYWVYLGSNCAYQGSIVVKECQVALEKRY